MRCWDVGAIIRPDLHIGAQPAPRFRPGPAPSPWQGRRQVRPAAGVPGPAAKEGQGGMRRGARPPRCAGGGRLVACLSTERVRAVQVRAARRRASGVGNQEDGGSQRPTTAGGERSVALAPPVREDTRAVPARFSSLFTYSAADCGPHGITPRVAGPFPGLFAGYDHHAPWVCIALDHDP